MSRKVDFYTIAFYHEDNVVDYPVKDFLEKLEQMIHNEDKGIMRNIKGEYIRAFLFYRPQPNQNRLVMPLGKLKSKNKPYCLNEENGKLEEFKRELFDLNSLAYDSRNKIMLFTTNREGPRIDMVEEYLNSFLPKNLEIRIKIEAIMHNIGLESVRNAEFVRGLTISLDLGASLNQFYSDQIINEENNLIKAFRNMAFAGKEEGNGRKLTLTLGVGNGNKEASLDLTNTLQLLDDININGDFIKEIVVHYKNGREDKIDSAHLKNSSSRLFYSCKGVGNQLSPEELVGNMENAISSKIKIFRPFVRKRLEETILVQIDDFDIL